MFPKAAPQTFRTSKLKNSLDYQDGFAYQKMRMAKWLEHQNDKPELVVILRKEADSIRNVVNSIRKEFSIDNDLCQELLDNLDN